MLNLKCVVVHDEQQIQWHNRIDVLVIILACRIACRQSINGSDTGHDTSSTHDSITADVWNGCKPFTTSVGNGDDGLDVDDVFVTAVVAVEEFVVITFDG